MTYDHVHGYVRVRRLPSLLLWAAFRLGLGRFVVSSGDAPHHPDCTPTTGVLVAE